MGNIPKAGFWQPDFAFFHRTCRHLFHALADATNNVMVVVLLAQQLVAGCAVAKLTAAYETQRLEFGQTSVDSY